MLSTFPTSSQQKSAVMLSTSSFPQLWAHPQLPRALRDTAMCKKLFSCPTYELLQTPPTYKTFLLLLPFHSKSIKGRHAWPQLRKGERNNPISVSENWAEAISNSEKGKQIVPKQEQSTVSNCDTVLFPVELFTPWLILPTPQSKELWSLPIFFCLILSSQKADRLSSLWEGVNQCWRETEGQTNESYPPSFSDFNWSEVMGNFCAHKSMLNNSMCKPWFDGQRILSVLPCCKGTQSLCGTLVWRGAAVQWNP